MARTRVSTKFQVVIPKSIREDIGLQQGQEMEIVAKGGVITLIPDRTLRSMRGFLKGLPARGLREKKDRF